MKSRYLLQKISGSIVILSAIIPVVFAQTENVFPDVRVGDKHYCAIQFLKQNNIINGYEDGNFHPGIDINRVEALKIIQTVFAKKTEETSEKDAENSTPKIDFKDVKPHQWFYDIVKKGLSENIISGYPDKSFNPQKSINRAEALKMAILQENKHFATIIEKQPYSDVPIDAWFAPFAQVSKSRDLFIESRNNGGELLPDATVNRGEFAELMYHLIQSANGSKFGRATFYSDSLAGRGTSNGDSYKPGVFTTAHRSLPMGTKLLVKNLANGEEVTVKVNDRGPFATGIELDLSKSAFAAIASVSEGIINTEYKIIPD